MNKLLVLAPALLVSALAMAQPAGPGGPPPPMDIAKVLNLDAARAAQVEAVMKAARDQREALRAEMQAATTDEARLAVMKKMRAIQEDIKARMAAILTADELKKLEESRPKRPHREPS